MRLRRQSLFLLLFPVRVLHSYCSVISKGFTRFGKNGKNLLGERDTPIAVEGHVEFKPVSFLKRPVISTGTKCNGEISSGNRDKSFNLRQLICTFSQFTGKNLAIPRIQTSIYLLLLIGLFSQTSCNTIFEDDLSEKVVDLIIPTDNDTSYTNNVHFKWNGMEGATSYRLQIVEPSFLNINTFILDTAIEAEEFFYILSPGNYQFQIRGENSAYESIYTGPYSLYVDSVSDLSNQVVPLIAPVDLIFSNADNFTFSWQSVYAAETYEFELRSGAFFSSGTSLQNTTNIYGTSYSTPAGLFPTEAAYSWGVKAHNQTSSSSYSDRVIYIDRTSPNDPIASSPNHGDTFVDTVVFKWNTGIDPGIINSPVSAHLEIGSDTLFGTILQEYDVNIDSVQHIFTTPNIYWWRVYLFDEAGNISTFYSEHRKIVIP